MKVYGSPTAPTTRMLLTAFAEKGHAPELVHIDLSRGEQKQPEHRARHPFGTTPVLEDDGHYFYESRAILRYLDRRLSGPSLTPSDVREYGMMEQLIGVEQAYFSPNAMIPFYARFRPSDAATLEAARKATGEALNVVEGTLTTGLFLTGATFSLADISWMPYVSILFTTGDGEMVTGRPRVDAWWKRVSGRASWAGILEV